MKRLLLFVLAGLLALAAAAQGVLPVPALTGHVVDQTGTLSEVQRAGLEAKLATFERTKGTQLVVLLVPTTQPEDIVSYANRVANDWKVGRPQVGDGVVLVVAKDDRRVRIEVAKTLEGAVPDLAAKQVIDTAITPRFRAGDFAGGLQDGVDQLIARINGEPLPVPVSQARGMPTPDGGFDWMDGAIFLFFAVPVAGAVLRGIFGRRLGALFTGAGTGALALVVTGSIGVAVVAAVIGLVFALFSAAGLGCRHHRGWGGPVIGGWGAGGGFGGGGGWGGGGGGGFRSGGGGDFGGGGASGDW